MSDLKLERVYVIAPVGTWLPARSKYGSGSTPDLLRQLGAARGHPARLFPRPPALLKLAGRLTGKAEQVERLLGSLRVDSGKIRRELGWRPPIPYGKDCKTPGRRLGVLMLLKRNSDERRNA